ncbi:MAG: MATE family efflux transporter [Polyangiaceae bacterium]
MSEWERTRRELWPTLALALPIVVGQVAQMSIGLTDTAFIGRLGEVQLAAAAFTAGIFGMFYVVGVGLLSGAGVCAARDFGARNVTGSAAWLRHGRAFALLVGMTAFAALALLSTQFESLRQPPAVIAIVRPFFLLVAASLVPSLFFQAQRQFAEAVGHPRGPMLIIFSGFLLNALLNWVFIFGHWGSRPLGLVGSGWSTLLARFWTVLASSLWLRYSPHFAELRAARSLGWELERFATLLRLGAPTGAMLLFERGAFGASSFLMGWLGELPLAAHQIALSCASLTFMVPLGLSNAVSVRISRARGAGQDGSVLAIGWGALSAGLVFMLAGAFVFSVAGKSLGAAFTPAGEVVALAARLLTVAAIFQVFDGAQVISVGALRGLTDVRLPMVITFVAYWLISLPLGYWLGFHAGLGAVGLWIGLAAGLGSAAIALVVRFHFKARQHPGLQITRPV